VTQTDANLALNTRVIRVQRFPDGNRVAETILTQLLARRKSVPAGTDSLIAGAADEDRFGDAIPILEKALNANHPGVECKFRIVWSRAL